jgi:trimeric autotransporter adhesin
MQHRFTRRAPRGHSSALDKDHRQRRLRRMLGVATVVTVAAVVAAGAFGVTGSNTITTIAGNGTQGFSGDGGPATSAQLRTPGEGIAVDGAGNVYFSDTGNSRVRKVTPGGTISTFAGTGGGGAIGDGGLATSARIDTPLGLAVDGLGNVYIADAGPGSGARVRKVNPAGIITTYAGTSASSFSGDGGPATAAALYAPRGLALDGQGNLYIADMYNQRIRKVDSSGTITTFAGTSQGFSGDGGPATSAKLAYPEQVTTDGSGNVYIADTSNRRVRKVSPSGTITTFAGSGGGPLGDGGPATSATLSYPKGLEVDDQGNLYIADWSNYRVRKVDTGGTITTVVGTGSGGFQGDGGPAGSATVFGPVALALDGLGNLYIADSGNYRLRKVLNTEVPPQSIAFAALANKTYGDPDFTVSATASSGLPVSFTASGNCSVSGTTVHITGAGSCTITASQPGGAGYPAATSESRTFAIAKASQTITFAALANKKLGDPDFTVSASASSRLAVAFAASGRCTVTGARIHLTGAGTCTVTASQAGNANYNAAPALARSFSIGPIPQRCKVPNVVGKSLARAKALIKQRHCLTGTVTKAYSRKRKNVVIGQSRRPGRLMPANSKINLTISRGRRR